MEDVSLAALGSAHTAKSKQGGAAAVCAARSHRRPSSMLDDSPAGCNEDDLNHKRAKRTETLGESCGSARAMRQVRSRRREVISCGLVQLI